jgi:flavin reductase (DIM6/NTAB) family NADH-FMN oxidoreductase RutF
MNPDFLSLPRQKFRRFFQPSRIVLGVIPAVVDSGFNVLTLCFDMYCSYRPPMMAIAIQNINASYEQIQRATEYVLAVPGPSLVAETLFCGSVSSRDVDKIKKLKLDLCTSKVIAVPGLKRAIANIELVKKSSVQTGDHLVVFGEVVRFGVNIEINELPLLSIGPITQGYRILANQGIHRIATVLPNTQQVKSQRISQRIARERRLTHREGGSSA